jgi:hypothetical protein
MNFFMGNPPDVKSLLAESYASPVGLKFAPEKK